MTEAHDGVQLEWHGRYDHSWRDIITDASFAHPAKMARGLLDRILDHGLARGYWKAGDLLADPFGGIGTTGILASYKGLWSVSVELEPRFVEMAAANFALHAAKLETLGCPVPVMLEGDSRRFAALVGEAGAVITSPPYADRPPEKSSDGIDLVKQYETYRAQGGGASLEAFCETQRKHSQGYGSSGGNIGNLPEGDAQAVRGIVTSPPWAGFVKPEGVRIDYSKTQNGGSRATPARVAIGDGYGNTPGQIGAESSETYWSEMAKVYRQCHLVLRPGGVLAVVIKRYVKQGKIVPLPDQTWDLLLSIGFEPLERVRAMLVKETREAGLFGEVVKRKERKSFFRRLAEGKGAPPIDWEDVLFVKR